VTAPARRNAEEDEAMKTDVGPYRVAENEKVVLAMRPTKVEPLYGSKEDYSAGLAKHVESSASCRNFCTAPAATRC
jgi:hypothetical protein